ncbi:hypothetical protein IEQ34_011601 [Dendrobium chrysotoxum]|uniref:Uncharacterized protein n=1 Tax=Dendrobium chrysotoxum TaxID=161865 RepID=A0AAV7GR01_DENCH|nr:hypothetical protein IEQ34_011601 [Dendrobium chrysotoxum]
MRELALNANKILRAKKLRTANLLHLPLIIVHEHICGPHTTRSRQHPCSKDRRHPPRARRRVPPRPIDEYYIPRDVVQMVRQVVDAEPAVRK